MVRDKLERVLASVQRSDWLGPVAGVVATDLADDRHLGDLLGSDEHEAFFRASRLPRVRPILVVLAARASGAAAVDPELQYAAELLYTALIVHDLALGQPGGRRRTLARSVLRGVGWVGSNRLLLRAMELARHGPTPEVLSDLIDTLGAFHDGQEVSAHLVEQGVPTVELWQDHADGHTGALFAFCCRAGGHVGVSGEGQLAALGRYGRHLGRMWHLAEDIILLQSDDAAEHLAGRALIGRPMLPVAVAVARDATVGPLWRRLVDGADPAAAEALLGRLRDLRAIHGTRELMVRELWHARQAISRLDDTPYRHALERLVSGLSRGPYEDLEPGTPVY